MNARMYNSGSDRDTQREMEVEYLRMLTLQEMQEEFERSEKERKEINRLFAESQQEQTKETIG